jgi:hypothetical protein
MLLLRTRVDTPLRKSPGVKRLDILEVKSYLNSLSYGEEVKGSARDRMGWERSLNRTKAESVDRC